MIDYLRDNVDADLTRFVREVPNRADFLLTSQILPPVSVQSPLYKVKTADITISTAKMWVHNTPAPYSNIDTNRSVTKGNFPLLGGKQAVEEFELIFQNIAAGGNQLQLENAVYDNVKNQATAIWARLELAAGSLLATRKVEISENGFIQTIAFDKVAGKAIEDNIAANWTGANAKPLSDEQGWVRELRKTGAPKPGIALASSELIAKMCAAKEYVSQVYGGANAPTVIAPTQLNEIRARWGLAQLVEYDTQVFVDGVATRVLPADRLILLPDTAFETVGETQFGLTADALVMTTGGNPALDAVEAPGIVSTKLGEQDPPTVITRTVAAALPVLSNPGHFVTAKIA